MMKEQLQNDEIRLDLGKILQALLRNRLLILVSTAVGTAAAFLLALMLTPQYRSSVTFYVRNNGPAALGNSITSADIAASKELVDSYLVILQSEETIQAVIYHAQVDRSCQEVREMIRAFPVNSTEFFRVEVSCPDPSEAVTIANAIGYILPLRIAGILENASVRIVDGAALAFVPSEPGYGEITAMGFAGGLALSLLWVVLRTVTEKTIRNRRDLETVCDLPVLGELGKGDTCRSSGCRLLRSRLGLVLPQREGACLLGITAPEPDAGTTTIAWNLACSLRQQGKRVILLDCDLHGSQLAQTLGLGPGPGLADFLAGKCSLDQAVRQCFSKCRSMRFPVIPAGKRYARGTELLLLPRMAAMLRFCRKVSDYVILDLPPAAVSAETVELSRQTDGLLMVVRQNKSRTDTLEEALAQLTFAGGKILGIVLNNPEAEQGI